MNSKMGPFTYIFSDEKAVDRLDPIDQISHYQKCIGNMSEIENFCIIFY
jgi:hypothetical protein